MKTIELTQGQVAIVDDEDYEMLMDRKWFAGKAATGAYYAHSTTYDANTKKCSTLRMHRIVAGAKTGEQVDHLNHNTLDNQKSNLRICSVRQNHQNRRNHGRSPYPGVKPAPHSDRWVVHMRVNGKLTNIGTFDTEIDAAIAYRVACKQIRSNVDVTVHTRVKSSQYKGISKREGVTGTRWQATAYWNGKLYYAGYYATEIEAVMGRERKFCELEEKQHATSC